MKMKTATLGYPRMGEFRELKKSVESYWKQDISETELKEVAKQIRRRNWQHQQDQGVTYIPSNDFSFYDQILDMTCLLGNVPSRFDHDGGFVDLATFFTIARGNTKNSNNNQFASEMTKWFDTNYHYIVPEFNEKTSFQLSTNKIFDEYSEAKQLGIETRPVLIGPVTYLKIGKVTGGKINKYDLLDQLLEVYKEIFIKCESLGVTDLQLDEPIAALDLTDEEKHALEKAYAFLSQTNQIKIHLATYFGDLRDNESLIYKLPVYSIHLDHSRNDISESIQTFPTDKILSLGLVNGRNIWVNDFQKSLDVIKSATNRLGDENVIIASSCSLLHSPVTLKNEEKLNPEIKQWMSFADEKVAEIVTLSKIMNGEEARLLEKNKAAIEARSTSKLIHNPDVKKRVSNIQLTDFSRQQGFNERQAIQQDHFKFPLFPTTTIGSFPQTKEVRQARAQRKKGEMSDNDYNTFLESQVKSAVDFQENIGIDVLVHGEFERNDMVEYFGEQMDGFVFTQYGWVQSYGSRCVKPPVIFGDVSRPKPMTVKWSKYAQSLTKKYMKGMLTGPVTILQWSFVRDDQPRKDTTMQIGLAIRDEVCDLESAGIEVIQIDEAALREGLPIRKSDWEEYLTWSVDAFRLSTAGVKDQTQIHTHMCYSEFNDIIQAIARMDADVISIETSRSNMELLDAFVNFNYPNEVGPGVYDIHSPRVPSQQNMTNLIKKAAKVLPIKNIWVNPDCGLKTRGWPEVKEALTYMVNSAKELREAFKEVSVN